MRRLGSLMHHLRLVTRMGRATGTDLTGAYAEGRLDQDQWAGMVQSCRSCSWAGRCPEWLDGHESVKRAPKTCLNRTRFAALKAEQESRS
ncbi:DUF6455 family protein [Cribrihabitans sp. XS_ASV171]